jgi:hypothetical protein
VASYCEATEARFLEWAIRQSALTRVYNESLWKYGLFAYSFLDLVFLLGIISAISAVCLGVQWMIISALLLAPSLLGTLRSHQRCSTFKRALPHLSDEFDRTCLSGALVSFIMPWIMIYCILKSARTNEIDWRGRKYKLKMPD